MGTSLSPLHSYGGTDNDNASHGDGECCGVCEEETQRHGSGSAGRRLSGIPKSSQSQSNANGHEGSRLIPSSIQVDKGSCSCSTIDPLAPQEHEPCNNPNPRQRRSRSESWTTIHSKDDLNTIAESVFSQIRSDSTGTKLSIMNETEKYALCTAYQRAFPERSFALIVTLIFELPTLFLISGGSGQLCALIGRHKYTTLIAILPLISAISGNVGLQASTLTTRAISHDQVRLDNFAKWLRTEIISALYLGISIGLIIAAMAFVLGKSCVAFAFSIFVAQFIGIFTAGCTGTLAPLLFTFIFQRDSGKWGGPLETAVQDVVGSFAMIVVTYRIMLFFGPFELEPGDMC